jgi:cyclopropane-fatty-acyl-phospholipid synthase
MKKYMLDYTKQIVLKYLSLIQIGHLTLIDKHNTYEFGESTETASCRVLITIHSEQFYQRAIKGGSVGLAESYMMHEWSTPDLTRLVQLMVLNQKLLNQVENGFLTQFRAFYERIRYLYQKNSIKGSKKNIIAHYDLSNDFFQLFLDSSMMYSSAIYPYANASLEVAAEYKLQRICEKLNLRADDRVIEIGSGWGGFAIYAAKNYGCHVTTTTISEAQYQFAAERIQSAGLNDKITLLKQDYRTLKGQYSKLVSIEMLEAVGHQYMKTYFKQCAALLAPQGKALIQVITTADQRYPRSVYEIDFIKRYIFPGGFLPSLTAIAECMKKHTSLRILNVEDIGLHYARTLQDWRMRFLSHQEEVLALGFNDVFCRMWEYYLCYCEGLFLEQYISDMQFEIVHSVGL